MGKTFYIIDGHAHIYRAYFAPFRDLTSPSGEPVKATYVFTQMLLNLVQQRRPDYLAMVIDSEEGSAARKLIYPQYKSSRKQRPDDFTPQEQRILQVVRDAGVPIFAKPGVEADDLIATMAICLKDRGFDVLLVSRDKDLRQLVCPCIRMYDVQNDRVIDAAALEADCGFRPDQAIEVQTLVGDSIDDVPGVPGVGEKTAAKLIGKYGSVQGVIDHLDELTPRLRENLRQSADVLRLSRSLVTLDTRVEMDFDPETCAYRGLNLAALRPHFESLGFTSLLKRLEDSQAAAKAPAVPLQKAPPTRPVEQGLFGALEEPDQPEPGPSPSLGPPPSTCADCEYFLIDTPQKFSDFLAELRRQKLFAFDTETDALDPTRADLIGMSFSWRPQSGYYVPVRGPAGSVHLPRQQVLTDLKPILEDPAIAKVGHNLKYDLLVMRGAGIEMRGIAMDSMIAANLVDSSRVTYGIDRLALDLLNFRKIPTTDLLGTGRKQITMDQVPLDRVGTYAAEDADIALRLSELFRPQLGELPQIARLHDELETPLIHVLVEMEHNGIAIDPSVLVEQGQVLGERIAQLRAAILKSAGVDFNPDSPRQLADVLFGKLALRSGKKTKTGYSTDVEVLEKLALEHECPRLMLEYRMLSKLKNTYVDNLPAFINPRTGRIHPSFSQIGAETGRLSCNDPNLQNIPIRTDEGRRIRLAFVPGDRQRNVLLTADYSQIELRVLAHFTEEPALMAAFERDEDVHAAVAAEVFNVPLREVTRQQRGQAKTINFGIIYGVSAAGLARRIDGMTVRAAQDLINAYNQRFPSIQRFMQQCVMQAQAHGFVQTIEGRRRRIPQVTSHILSLRNAGERMAINSVIQGSAADLIKRAMLNVHRRLQRDASRSRMLLQVHDELVFETPAADVERDAALIRQEMVGAMALKVPLKVEIGWGQNWQEVK